MTAATGTAPSRARQRSNTELGLLLLAVVIAVTAYTEVAIAQSGEVPAGILPYGGALLALAVAAHLVTRRLAPGADPVLLPLAFLLNGLGLVMVRRLDFAFAAAPTPTAFAPAQTLWTVAAVTAFCATLIVLRDHRRLDGYRYLIGVVSLGLLMLPLLPVIGREVNGARLWLQLAGASFQPAEVAKLGLVAFFASYLAEKRQLLSVATSRLGPLMVPPPRAFGPVLVAWALSLGILVFQNDFGLSLLFFGMFVLMLYMSTSRVTYIALAGLLFVAGSVFAYYTAAHVQWRIAGWLDTWSLYDTHGYQLAQSLFAFGTGGLTGVGLGQGRPDFIPFVQTDFIFSAFGEELGLIGASAMLLCYLLIVGRGFAIALRSRDDDFGLLLAAGLTVLFALQVFVIIGGVTRLIPLTGLTLPFVSYGGSSLLSNYVLIALLLRISSTQQQEVRA